MCECCVDGIRTGKGSRMTTHAGNKRNKDTRAHTLRKREGKPEGKRERDRDRETEREAD